MPNVTTSKRNIFIEGTGAAQPSLEISSAERDRQLGLAPGTIEKISGVSVRRFASSTETAASLAARACIQALDRADVTPRDIDCLVAASATMDQSIPYNAALILGELGWTDRHIPAFDIGASCLSFLVALDQISWPLVAGQYRRVLIVSSDIASCGLDWSNIEASGIFGDGAAAAVVTIAPIASASGILASRFATFSAGRRYCEILGSGTRNHPTRNSSDYFALNQFRMDGKKVFKLVSKYLPDFIKTVISEAKIEAQDLDWIVPHQASLLAIKHLTQRLGLPPEKVIDIFSHCGNQVGASLPNALHTAIADGRIQRDNLVLLVGTGAGVCIGGMIMRT